ncbi:MAG: hypothetical protein HWE10_15085 [Gammaproteobacteria bacterium]|nr:hypothetical protein [Gammaproteobacteria bacterium]
MEQQNTLMTLDELFKVLPDLLFLLDKHGNVLDFRAGDKSNLFTALNTF